MSSYRCYWKKTESGYEMHMAEHPKISGKGATFELAMEELWEAVFNFKKDWEPHLALWPPKPVAKKDRHFTGAWLMLGAGGDRVRATVPMQKLFRGGICPVCDAGIGARTPIPLSFYYSELKGSDIGSVADGEARARVVSAEFVKTFMPGDEASDQLRPCHNTGNPTKKKYFEIRPANPLKPVPIKHLRAEIVKCSACGRTGIPPYYPIAGIPAFALKSDLDAIKGKWTFLELGMDLHRVIIRGDRVNLLKRSSGLEAVTFDWLGVANEEDVFEKVPVRTLK